MQNIGFKTTVGVLTVASRHKGGLVATYLIKLVLCIIYRKYLEDFFPIKLPLRHFVFALFGFDGNICLLSAFASVTVSSLRLQVLGLLQFLVIENQQKLKGAISRLEPFPDLPEFRELRSVQHTLKYNTGTFTLRQVTKIHASV